MRKQTPTLEWHIAESEDEWEEQQALHRPAIAPASSRRPYLDHFLWLVVALLLFLAGVGEWWQRSTMVHLQVVETDLLTPAEQMPQMVVRSERHGLTTTSTSEQTSADWNPDASEWVDYGWEYSGLPAPIQPNKPTTPLTHHCRW